MTKLPARPNMEVATSVLYLEAAFDDLDPNDPQLAVRTANLAQRLEGVRAGGQPQPLEGWMEELYRRVSDKQTMGSVVGELRVSLGELEKSLDVFFRNPQDKVSLQAVPGQLSQMRGVLSVLGLDQASHAVLRMPGFSTAAQVTELAGRGIGMDVVRSEVNSLGGRIETSTVAGKGTHFKLVLPLTTAVTQVVMIRTGNLSVGVPANVVETVRRASAKELQQAYNTGTLELAGEAIPFFWSGALLQASQHSSEVQGKTTPVVVFRSAAQRIALHVHEVLGNQEVVVKNLGPQLSRLPGLAGMCT